MAAGKVKKPIQKRDSELAKAADGERSRVTSIIRGMVGDSAEADDVFQETFADFIETYDVGTAIESVSAWFVQVAKNKVIDRFRRKKTQDDYSRLVQEVSEIEPDAIVDFLEREELREVLLNALETLPIEQRDVFVGHELEGKSYEEMSRETGVSVNTLLSRKRYATLALREYLKEVYDEL